jgi:fimbrial chaperone protein
VTAPILYPTQAEAFVIQQLSVAMAPSGKGASTRINISSSDPGLIDLDITPQRVSVTEDGGREFSPEPAAFLLFPPQMTLKPGGSQAVFVRYVGSPTIKTGAIYNLLVSQTNVAEVPRDSSGFGFMLAYNVTVRVNPPGARSNLTLEGVPMPVKNGAAVRVRNSGDAVADLSTYSWNVAVDGKRSAVNLADLRFGETRFLEPGKTRLVTVANMPMGASLALNPTQ